MIMQTGDRSKAREWFSETRPRLTADVRMQLFLYYRETSLAYMYVCQFVIHVL